MIETRDLTKTFDNFIAVDSLNLKIEKGEFFGLLGPNGAGKTTTISLLSTLLLPTKGEILIDGQQLTRQRPDLKRKISVITQEYSMRQDMNMDEIMEYQGRLYFMPRKEIKEKTKMPLVLHGGSGSGDENIKRCVEFGINKINVGCDFMNANVDSIKQHLKKDPDINYWVMMHQVEIDSQELVKKYIHLSGSEGKSL